MTKIGISAIHSGYVSAPPAARAGNEGFSRAAALSYAEANMAKTFDYVDKAGQAGTDLVCTHEDFTGISMYMHDFKHPGLFESLAEETCGLIIERMSALAKRHSMLIAANNFEANGERVYNTSTLYGRDGAILGRYRKVHLADSENWLATPGEHFCVIPTDIGNIGFIICYDMIFPEACRIMALNGADFVLHPTQGWGGVGGKAGPAVGEAFMRTRACENSVYLVVAKNMHEGGWDGGRSMIVDNYGNIVAESAVTEEGIVRAVVEPDFQMRDPYHFNNFYTGAPGCRARQLLARKPRLYGALTDERPPALSAYEGVKLFYSAEEGQKVMEAWDRLPEDEKKKYHW